MLGRGVGVGNRPVYEGRVENMGGKLNIGFGLVLGEGDRNPGLNLGLGL
jgi:hypothetical protein